MEIEDDIRPTTFSKEDDLATVARCIVMSGCEAYEKMINDFFNAAPIDLDDVTDRKLAIIANKYCNLYITNSNWEELIEDLKDWKPRDIKMIPHIVKEGSLRVRFTCDTKVWSLIPSMYLDGYNKTVCLYWLSFGCVISKLKS